MAEFPSMPVFTDAYLADCSHLSDAEHGVYFQLLMAIWRSPGCKIPDNDDFLARKFRRSKEDVKSQVRPIIEEFFQKKGNFLIQKRLMKEWKWLQEKREKNKNSAKSRWNKENEPCERISERICVRNAPHPTPPIGVTNNKHHDSTAAHEAGAGVLKNGKSGFDVLQHLREADMQAARRSAPQWDIYQLASIYNEGIANGKREIPKYPAKAFAAWCGKYTKGKPP